MNIIKTYKNSFDIKCRTHNKMYTKFLHFLLLEFFCVCFWKFLCLKEQSIRMIQSVLFIFTWSYQFNIKFWSTYIIKQSLKQYLVKCLIQFIYSCNNRAILDKINLKVRITLNWFFSPTLKVYIRLIDDKIFKSYFLLIVLSCLTNQASFFFASSKPRSRSYV